MRILSGIGASSIERLVKEWPVSRIATDGLEEFRWSRPSGRCYRHACGARPV